jgi:DUF971 family protein
MQAPRHIHYDRGSRTLTLEWQAFCGEITAELLRVFSPSAEVRGHGNDPRRFPSGKIAVEVESILPAGNYAIQIVFNDGHDSGIYRWAYLRELCENKDAYFDQYQTQLSERQLSRSADTQVVKFISN